MPCAGALKFQNECMSRQRETCRWNVYWKRRRRTNSLPCRMHGISPELMFNCSCLLCADKNRCVFGCSHSSVALSGTQVTASRPDRWLAPAIALSCNQLSIFDYSTPCVCPAEIKHRLSARPQRLIQPAGLYLCQSNNLEINNSLLLAKFPKEVRDRLCDTQGLKKGPYFYKEGKTRKLLW